MHLGLLFIKIFCYRREDVGLILLLCKNLPNDRKTVFLKVFSDLFKDMVVKGLQRIFMQG